MWQRSPEPCHLTDLPLWLWLDQNDFQPLSESSGVKMIHLYHTNMLISSKPSLLPTMTCSTQRQCISCCFLGLPTLSKELLLHFELIRTSLPGTLWTPGTWLLLASKPDSLCCYLCWLTAAQLSFHLRERHKRCSVGQQEPSEGQKVSKPVSWLLLTGVRLWKWYYTLVLFVCLFVPPPLLSHYLYSFSSF